MVRNFKELNVTSPDAEAHRLVGYRIHAKYAIFRNDSDANIAFGMDANCAFKTLAPTDEYEFSPGELFDLNRFYMKTTAAGKTLRILYA